MAEGVSPEINARTPKDDMALFQDKNMQRATGADKDIMGIR